MTCIHKTYTTLFFDMDGTISESHEGITKSIQYALRLEGVSIADPAKLNHFVGPPLEESFEKHYGYDGEQLARAIGNFRAHYQKDGYMMQQIYPGMAALIRRLKDSGASLAIATSKPTKYAKIILEQYGILDLFDYVAGAKPDRSRVKKTDVLTHGLDMMGVKSPENALMIGDREHDIFAAKQLGTGSVGVLFGYGTREVLESYHPDFIAETVDDLSRFLIDHI
jgi:phosphoglycolate phosphatase